MKNKYVNLCLVLAVVGILAVFARYVRIGTTADAVVVMKTSGMTCGSCSEKISKVLQNEKGVAATEVDLEGGWVIAGFNSKQVTADKLAQKVTGLGFGSTVQAVVTPQQFKKIVGHEVGREGGGAGCCGSRGCCQK